MEETVKARGIILLSILLFMMVLAGCKQETTLPTNVEIGMQEIEAGQYQKALTTFGTAILEEQDLVNAYRGEGIAYMGLGNYDEAIISFDEAIARAEDKQGELVKDIRYYKAATLYKTEDFTGTISVCDDILAEDSEADAYYLRGTSYLEQGEAEKAKIDFDIAVSQQPQDYDLYLNIYASYLEKNLSAEGDLYLQKALEIDSKNKEDAYHKARIYYHLENYEQAKTELTELVGEQGEKALLLMGKTYQAMEDYPHARNMYEQYILVHGETPTAYNGIALADIGEENYDRALGNIAKGLALAENKGKQELYYNEIVAYEFKGDFQTAKEKALTYRTSYVMDPLGKKEYDFLQNR